MKICSASVAHTQSPVLNSAQPDRHPTPTSGDVTPCNIPPPADTWLRDNPNDASTTTLINRILATRAKTQAGLTITEEDMLPYSTITTGNEADLSINREYFSEKILPAIRNAQQSIHIAMLAFTGGHLGSYIADLLIKKKQENPDLKIRVIADSLNSKALMPWSKSRHNLNRLKEAGVEVVFNNYFTEGMDHRKSIIVDSQHGFFGGACFKDNYFGNEAYWKAFEQTVETHGLHAARDSAFLPEKERSNLLEVTPAMERPEYADFGVSLHGPAVHQLQGSFLQSWLKQEKSLEPDLSNDQFRAKYFPALPCKGGEPIKLTRVIPFGHGEMQQSLLSVIEGAQHTLDIEMAYIHVREFTEALVRAANRGVKIRLISNSQHGIDAEASWHISRQYYPQLLAAGVQLYELDKFSHRKLIVADKRLVFASTGNPEFHSWEMAWDEVALIDSADYATKVMERVIKPGLDPENSQEVNQSHLEEESLWTRMKSAIICFFYNVFSTLFRFFNNPNLEFEERVHLVTPALVRNSANAAVQPAAPPHGTVQKNARLDPRPPAMNEVRGQHSASL